jgi:uncharacterized membrane protein YbhN (UPF0104 family)
MKQRFRSILSILFLALFTSWLIFYITVHVDDFKIIPSLSWPPALLLALVILAESYASGLFIKAVMTHFNINLGFNEWYGLSVVTRFWNILLPFRGGAGVRAVYLKKIHKFPLTDFFATMLSLYFLIFLVNSAIGILCMLILYAINDIFLMPLFIFFLGFFLVMLGIVWFSPRIPESRYAIWHKISRAANAWHGIRTNTLLMRQLTIITLLNSAVGLLTVYFSYVSFGASITIFQCLLISTLFNFTSMINITPGALGVVESVMILTAQLFEIRPAESLLAAALIRAVHMTLMFTLGIMFNYRLGLKLRDQFALAKQTE